ncbi:hypothetical protein B0H13DRAFT_2344380 [Mycena leptocephala]|nr:hypothetical protein B0H13DRAFT_2344380 [Mycena leptocephala]
MWDSKRKQLVVAAVVTVLVLTFHRLIHHQGTPAIPAQCPSTPHPTLSRRTGRFVEGTSHVLIRNAKILTGARNGTEVVFGNELLEKCVVLGVGYIPHALAHPPPKPIIEADFVRHCRCPFAFWSIFCAGIGGRIGRKLSGRRFCLGYAGLNTHDDLYRLAIAGGLDFAWKWPGISHQAASNRRALCISHAVGAPGLNVSDNRSKWRHMKHACGENPSETSQMRMDSAWAFRAAYDEARKIRDAQDVFCAHAEWESLVDVLRGRVKLSVHCYEVVDLDQLIGLSDEFRFPIASIHHAGENVPRARARPTEESLELLYFLDNIPAIALFASDARYAFYSQFLSLYEDDS